MADIWGNVDSNNPRGWHAAAHKAAALQTIATLVGVDGDQILVTSGGTESSNIVLHGDWDIIVSTPVEHDATFRCLENTKADTLLLPVQSDGSLNREDCIQQLHDASARLLGKRVLFSVILVNNEIGTIQDTSVLQHITQYISQITTVWVHVDAVQAIGHTNIRMGPHDPLHFVHYVSLSAHKFHGPEGIGLLLYKDGSMLRPVLHGGSQQHGLRAGTQHPRHIVVTAVVISKVVAAAENGGMRRMQEICNQIRHVLIPFVQRGLIMFTGHPTKRSSNHVSFCVKNIRSSVILTDLANLGVAVSAGSACHSTHTVPSRVLIACAIPMEFLHGAIRISCSLLTTRAETLHLLQSIQKVLAKHLTPSPPISQKFRHDSPNPSNLTWCIATLGVLCVCLSLLSINARRVVH